MKTEIDTRTEEKGVGKLGWVMTNINRNIPCLRRRGERSILVWDNLTRPQKKLSVVIIKVLTRTETYGTCGVDKSLERHSQRRRRDMRDDPAEILFQSSLREAIVSSSGMDRDVLSLTLSIQHFLCRPRRRPPSKVPWRMTMERLSWRVTYPNHTNVRLLTGNVKRRKWLYSTYYSSHRVSTGHSVTGKQTRTIPLLFWLHVSECEVAEKRKTYFPVAALLRGKRNAQIPDRHAPHFAHAQKRECVRSQTCLGFLRVRPVGNGSSLNEKSDNHTDDSRGL